MVNNEERFCKVCGRITLFFLQSDLLWYCDECDNVWGTNNAIKKSDFSELEDENGESLICPSCNNFLTVEDVLEDGMCPICLKELEHELEEKGYTYDEEKEIYCKQNKDK